MTKHFFCSSLTLLSLSLSAFAASNSASTISKDEWLGKLKDAVPAIICKNFTNNAEVNKQLEAVNINYDKCVTLIPASVDKCKGQYYSGMPENLDKTSAQTWGSTLGQCIGTDFASTYLKTGTPATAVIPSDSAAIVPSDSSSSTTTTTTTDTSSQSVPSTGSPSPSNSMTKDEWLAKLKLAVPELICKGFLDDKDLNQRLTKLNIDMAKCLTLIPPSIDKCQTEFYATIPATIDQDNAGKWGHTIGECIGKDFAIKHLVAQ